MAENLDESPWGGYPASAGVDTPSAVTVHCGEAPHNVHDMESSGPGSILDKVASTMTSLGSNNAPVSSGEFFVLAEQSLSRARRLQVPAPRQRGRRQGVGVGIARHDMRMGVHEHPRTLLVALGAQNGPEAERMDANHGATSQAGERGRGPSGP